MTTIADLLRRARFHGEEAELSDAEVRAMFARAVADELEASGHRYRATLRWSPPANHDPGDEDRR